MFAWKRRKHVSRANNFPHWSSACAVRVETCLHEIWTTKWKEWREREVFSREMEREVAPETYFSFWQRWNVRNACVVITCHYVVASERLIRIARAHTHTLVSGHLQFTTLFRQFKKLRIGSYMMWCHIIIIIIIMKRKKLPLRAFTAARILPLAACIARCCTAHWHKCATYADNLSN